MGIVLSKKLYQVRSEPKSVLFQCPGCKLAHMINVGNGHEPKPRWDWDGNVEAPTFSPSILVTWKDPDGELSDDICHSFVRGGRIEFLGDCTHELKGQTVEIADLPPYYTTEA